MATIRIHGREESFPADITTSLLNTLLRNRFPIDTVCGGRAICGRCLVRVVSGASFLSPVRGGRGRPAGCPRGRRGQPPGLPVPHPGGCRDRGRQHQGRAGPGGQGELRARGGLVHSDPSRAIMDFECGAAWSSPPLLQSSSSLPRVEAILSCSPGAGARDPDRQSHRRPARPVRKPGPPVALSSRSVTTPEELEIEATLTSPGGRVIWRSGRLASAGLNEQTPLTLPEIPAGQYVLEVVAYSGECRQDGRRARSSSRRAPTRSAALRAFPPFSRRAPRFFCAPSSGCPRGPTRGCAGPGRARASREASPAREAPRPCGRPPRRRASTASSSSSSPAPLPTGRISCSPRRSCSPQTST